MPDNTSGEFIIDPNKPNEPTEVTVKVKKNHAHFFTSLISNPENVKFDTQEENEEIILLIRRDLITNVPWILAALILTIIPFIVSAASSLITPFINISANTQLILLLFYYLIVFGFILVQFSLWYFTVGIITTIRVIDLDVTGILTKHLAETRLNLVEDVSYTQNGSIPSVFNYGDVHVQTAGSYENFEFDRVPEPAKIVRIISDMIGGPR